MKFHKLYYRMDQYSPMVELDFSEQQTDEFNQVWAYCGSNEQINHQLLSSTENLEKSNDITHFGSIESINPEMLCSRYRSSLSEATDINSLKIILSRLVHEDIVTRSKLSDSELLDIYKKYCEKYNLRRDTERAVKKFRDYCKERKIQQE